MELVDFDKVSGLWVTWRDSDGKLWTYDKTDEQAPEDAVLPIAHRMPDGSFQAFSWGWEERIIVCSPGYQGDALIYKLRE